MATMNADYNAGPARPATAWKQRLGTGAVAWVAIGVATALLDPRTHGAGVIELFGGVAPWLATGAGLAAAYAVGRTVRARSGRAAGLLAAGLSLALIVTVLALTDWQAVTSAILTLIGGVVGLALLAVSPGEVSSDSDDFTEGLSSEFDFPDPYLEPKPPYEDPDRQYGNKAWWEE